MKTFFFVLMLPAEGYKPF